MSVSNIKVILDRIKSATSASPIAVFKTKEGLLDASFSCTVEGYRRLDKPYEGEELVGLYDKSLCQDEIRSELREALSNNPFYTTQQYGGYHE